MRQTEYMRIVLILPCCIGDVVLATAALRAVRRAVPDAHITWAISSWAKPAIEHHPDVNAVWDTGASALPVKDGREFVAFVRGLRAGKFDIALSLVRSPLMSAAVLLSGIPVRAGLDSGGRGFGYTAKVKIDPRTPRHEADLYLDVVAALGADTSDCYANIPVSDTDRRSVRAKITAWIDSHERFRATTTEPLLVINPTGGNNPGMTLDAKRYPPDRVAPLADRLARRLKARLVLIGGRDDGEIVRAVRDRLSAPGSAIAFVGQLSFGEIGALAAESMLYIGNDTGMTHLAAATGARTVMILGPTDPARYAPFTPRSLALWRPAEVQAAGVSAGIPANWNWELDGITPADAEMQIIRFLARTP